MEKTSAKRTNWNHRTIKTRNKFRSKPTPPTSNISWMMKVIVLKVEKSKLENIRDIIEELYVMCSLKGLDIVLKEINEILTGEENE